MIRSAPRATTRSSGPAALLTGCLLSAAFLAGTLAGCSPAPELGQGAAKQLQSQVLAVTEASAGSDPAASLKLLDELVTTLDGAAARGEVSFKRHQSIRKSVDTVRSDLTAQQAAAEAARAAAAEAARVAAEQESARVAAEQEAARVAAEQEAAAQAAAPVPPPAVAPLPPADGGKKPKGKGKG